MRLGVIKAVTTSGERVVLEVQIDEARYKEVALLHPLGLRIRVAPGDRVLVGQLEQNADALFAWPVTISREVEPAIDIIGDEVWIRSPNGTAVPLAKKSDVDAVNTRVTAIQTSYNAHTHLPGSYTVALVPVVGTSATPLPLNNATATVEGTSVVMGE